MRQASTLSSTRHIRVHSWSTRLPAKLNASYATKSSQDYIYPNHEQPKDEDEFIPKKYVEATNWAGLESVGHTDHWTSLPEQPSDKYIPFLNVRSKQKVDREYVLTHLYTAILDVLANQKLGHQDQDLYTGRPDLRTRKAAASLGLELAADGTLIGLQEGTQTLENALSGNANEEAITDIVYTDLEAVMAKVKLNFSDPITFEILKYFTTLSGHRVPDPVLGNVWNNNKPLTAFASLLTQHFVHMKKKTVNETLHLKQEKAMLASNLDSLTHGEIEEASPSDKKRVQPLGSNVMVFSRRETPIDKHKEVGRWKVIERELTARGLPVPGRRRAALTQG